MAKFNFVRDEERSQSVAQFTGKVLSISPEPVGEYPSGKKYRVGTIEFENNSNQKVQRTCLINEANYQKGMSEGNEYLCSAIVKDGQNTVLLVCSHLVGTARASADDFGLGEVSAVVKANPLLVG
jgi:hypothetical protein